MMAVTTLVGLGKLTHNIECIATHQLTSEKGTFKTRFDP